MLINEELDKQGVLRAKKARLKELSELFKGKEERVLKSMYLHTLEWHKDSQSQGNLTMLAKAEEYITATKGEKYVSNLKTEISTEYSDRLAKKKAYQKTLAEKKTIKTELKRGRRM